MHFSIRQATEADVPEILNLIRGIAVYEKMENEVIATEESLRASMFERHMAHALLGELDGKVIGFALYFYNFSTFNGCEGLYLEDLFVWEEYRGKGYGKALFCKVAEIAVAQNCPRYEWTCLDWNQPSLAFYHSMGAVPMDQWTVQRLSGDALKKAAACAANSQSEACTR